MEYYDISKIYKANKAFNIICGMRTAGKTYGWKMLALAQFPEFDFELTDNLITEGYYTKQNQKFIYVRRQKEDIRLTAGVLFTDIVNDYNKNNGTDYYIEHMANKFYLMQFDVEKNKAVRVRHIGYSLYIKLGETFKSSSYDDANLLVHEEALTSNYNKYLDHEVDDFIDLINTCFRLRKGNRVFLIGNVSSIVNPYFDAWKIKNINIGITIHSYYNKLLSKTMEIAVEYTQPPDIKKTAQDNEFLGLASDKYLNYNIANATKDDEKVNVKAKMCVRAPIIKFDYDDHMFFVSRISYNHKKLYISQKVPYFYATNPKRNVQTLIIKRQRRDNFYLSYTTQKGAGRFLTPSIFDYLRLHYINDNVLFDNYQTRVRFELFLKRHKFMS